jgi:para-aminobenzoate synthetase/4-amino-4-deoxychorismate lyase
MEDPDEFAAWEGVVTVHRVWGRFDDLVEGTAMRFGVPARVLTARTAADVVPVLKEVERAAERGWWAFGYVAYEAAVGLDPSLPVVAGVDPPTGMPLVWFGLSREPDWVPLIEPAPGRSRDYEVGPWQQGWTLSGYRNLVARVRARIAAGESYQCNLTVRLRARIVGDLEQFYADLVWSQRGRYGAFLDLDRHVVVSASPELFFEWAGGVLLTRPMKGTAPRGHSSADDARRVRRLMASDKERAENVMIVDLMRNDLSRVAAVGTVQVPVLFGRSGTRPCGN